MGAVRAAVRGVAVAIAAVDVAAVGAVNALFLRRTSGPWNWSTRQNTRQRRQYRRRKTRKKVIPV